MALGRFVAGSYQQSNYLGSSFPIPHGVEFLSSSPTVSELPTRTAGAKPVSVIESRISGYIACVDIA